MVWPPKRTLTESEREHYVEPPIILPPKFWQRKVTGKNKRSILKHNRGAIHTSVNWSKWNMGENFGLKFHLSYLHTPQRFFWNSTMRKEGHFCYCRTYLPPFYVVEWIRRKWLPHVAISKIFFLDHFSPSFLGHKW